MIFFFTFISCGEKTSQDTQDADLTCISWEDSCSGCTWMCTDEQLKPDVVCEIECTEPVPEGECMLLEDNTCGFE